MKLLMDIGNRRLKWATVGYGNDNGNVTVTVNDGDAFAHDDLQTQLPAQFASLKPPQSVWISCVARAEIKSAVAKYVRERWSVQPHFITAQKNQAGVVNHYADPATLGSDRWAAAVAAANLFPRQATVIVDVGTAVTVDLLDGDGNFRGGVIFAGLHAMQSTLNTQAENIATDTVTFAVTDDFVTDTGWDSGTSTVTAVKNGALFAVAGGIKFAVQQHRARPSIADDCKVIATGGDAETIATVLAADGNLTMDIDRHLVLRGLAVIAREAE